MNKLRYAALAASAMATATLAAPAHAGTTIVLNGIGGINANNPGAARAYAVAAAYWESVLTNNATIAFNVGFSVLGNNILAQAGSTKYDIATRDVYRAMLASGNSALDASAMASLTAQIAAGGGSGVNMLLSSLTNVNNTFYDTTHSGPDSNNDVTYANSSVLKALGLLGGSGVDASITFNSNVVFDFDPSDGIMTGATDFVGVAIHEMGHGLGFTSGVDLYDIYGGPDGPGAGSFTDAEFQNFGGLNSTLDFFRYSRAGVLDWSVNSNSYFSIDGGVSEFNNNAGFSSGNYNGDGWQASHWQAPRNISGAFTCTKTDRVGIMNPYLCGGQTGDVTVEDLAAFDAMGWNTSVNVLANPNYYATSSSIFTQFAGAVQVPEPSTWTMLILGFGVAGAAMRRKKRAPKLIFAF